MSSLYFNSQLLMLFQNIPWFIAPVSRGFGLVRGPVAETGGSEVWDWVERLQMPGAAETKAKDPGSI